MAPKWEFLKPSTSRTSCWARISQSRIMSGCPNIGVWWWMGWWDSMWMVVGVKHCKDDMIEASCPSTKPQIYPNGGGWCGTSGRCMVVGFLSKVVNLRIATLGWRDAELEQPTFLPGFQRQNLHWFFGDKGSPPKKIPWLMTWWFWISVLLEWMSRRDNLLLEKHVVHWTRHRIGCHMHPARMLTS